MESGVKSNVSKDPDTGYKLYSRSMRLAQRLANATLQHTEAKLKEDLDDLKVYLEKKREWGNKQASYNCHIDIDMNN